MIRVIEKRIATTVRLNNKIMRDRKVTSVLLYI